MKDLYRSRICLMSAMLSAARRSDCRRDIIAPAPAAGRTLIVATLSNATVVILPPASVTMYPSRERLSSPWSVVPSFKVTTSPAAKNGTPRKTKSNVRSRMVNSQGTKEQHLTMNQRKYTPPLQEFPKIEREDDHE